MIRNAFSALALGATLLAGTASASAQDYPNGGRGPEAGYGPEMRYDAVGSRHVEGVVRSFGGFNMTVRVGGEVVPVNLHRGTIIHPTGLTLQRGMLVRCEGYFNGNGLFIAERIILVR